MYISLWHWQYCFMSFIHASMTLRDYRQNSQMELFAVGRCLWHLSPLINFTELCEADFLSFPVTKIWDQHWWVCLLPECQNRFSCLFNQKIVKYPGKDWHDGIDSTDWEIDGACCRDQHSDRSKGFPGVIVVDLNDPLDETCWREINILTERQWVWLPDRAMHLVGKDRTVREQI